MLIRPARQGDGAALAEIDTLTWSAAVSPAPAPAPDAPFFTERTTPEQFLVASCGASVAGYVQLGAGFGIPAHTHVVVIDGLAVHPDRQGHGVGERLVSAAVDEAAHRGARKVTLRVLGPNAVAQRLYARCGFVVEGVLREEFLLDGRYVDDVLMARMLASSDRDHR